MFYKVKLGMVALLSIFGALTVAQWTILACLTFGVALTIALHYKWLQDNPQWVIVGLIVTVMFGAALVGGHDVWVKRVIAVLIIPTLAFTVKALQSPVKAKTSILVEAHKASSHSTQKYG